MSMNIRKIIHYKLRYNTDVFDLSLLVTYSRHNFIIEINEDICFPFLLLSWRTKTVAGKVGYPTTQIM